MDYIADLHTHSPIPGPRARGNLSGLAGWARVKGIQVIGTGDFIIQLVPMPQGRIGAGRTGLFRLKDEKAIASPLAG